MSFRAAPPTAAWRTPSRHTAANNNPTPTNAIPGCPSRTGHEAQLARRSSTSLAAQHINGQIDVEVVLPEPSGVEEEAAASTPPQEGDDNSSSSSGTCAARVKEVGSSSSDQDPPLVARSLDSVRSSLIRQEETIIFALIERDQFRQNSAIYTDRTFRLNKNDAADIFGRDASFLEYMLCETEKLHSRGVCVLCVCVLFLFVIIWVSWAYALQLSCMLLPLRLCC